MTTIQLLFVALAVAFFGASCFWFWDQARVQYIRWRLRDDLLAAQQEAFDDIYED
jgi:hypothetical protein